MIEADLTALAALAAELGSDIGLVQGPGGNISLKSHGSLWVKASGTWLSEAQDRPIFAHLDLGQVKCVLSQGAEDFSECLRGDRTLRPSIETSLHALMPRRVVAHVHSINALRWAVRSDGQEHVARRLEGLNWAWVDYVRPGLPLTAAVQRTLRASPDVDVLVLANHGLVVACDTTADVRLRLADIENRLKPPALPQPHIFSDAIERLHRALPAPARLPNRVQMHVLGQDSRLAELVGTGALYPDHVVFLGRSLNILSERALAGMAEAISRPPYYAIVAGLGVALGANFSRSAEAMLDCLALLAPLLPGRTRLRFLHDTEIAELLDWDAEKMRQQINKSSP